MTTTSAPGLLQPAQRRRERPRVARGQHEHGRAGPDRARDDARAAARTGPRRGPTGARGGRAPAGPGPAPTTPRTRAIRVSAPRVARRHEAERDPPLARASGRASRRRRTATRRRRSRSPASHAGAVDRLDVERDQHLPLARRLEALGHRPPDPGARPGVDPADRVARGVGPDAGEPRRVLGEAASRAVEVAPAVGRLDLGRRDRPRPDEERVDLAPEVGRGAAGERVADGQVHGPDAEHAAPVRPDVEPADDALPRPQRPGVAQDLGPGLGAVREVALADDHPGRTPRRRRAATGSGSRRRFQTSICIGISSPNADPARREPARVADVADAGPRPRLGAAGGQRPRRRCRQLGGRDRLGGVQGPPDLAVGEGPGHEPTRPGSRWIGSLHRDLVRGLARVTMTTPMGRKVRQEFFARHPARPAQGEGHRRRWDRASAQDVGYGTVSGARRWTALEVTNVIWCTGFVPDFAWIDLPVFGEEEDPGSRSRRRRIERACSSLGCSSFMHWPRRWSAGSGRDAEHIATHIASSRRNGQRRARPSVTP